MDVRGEIPRLEEDVKKWSQLSQQGHGLGVGCFCFFVVEGVI